MDLNEPKKNGMIILFVVIALVVLTIVSIGVYYSISVTNSDNSINPNYEEDYALEISACAQVSEELGLGYGDDCYINLAEDVNEPGICNELSEDNLKNYCLAGLLKDSKYCDEMDDGEFKDGCYYGVARSSNDVDFCPKAADQEAIDRCYLDIGGELGDLSICDMISDETSFKEPCYVDVAVKNKDRTICAGLSERSHDACYSDLARVLPDTSLCEEIDPENTVQFNNCYRWIAGQTGDASVCESVTSWESDKEACLRAAEEFNNS